MDQQNFILFFKSLVRPHLNITRSPNVFTWSPILKKISNSFEMHSEELEDTSNLPTLKYRRFKGDMIQTYTGLHDLCDIDFSWFFIITI